MMKSQLLRVAAFCLNRADVVAVTVNQLVLHINKHTSPDSFNVRTTFCNLYYKMLSL
jgi:hypothetical protein